MRKSKFSEHQIIAILKAVEAGAGGCCCRQEHGLSERRARSAVNLQRSVFYDVSHQLFRQTVEGTFKPDVGKKLRQLGVALNLLHAL